jgi:hypothetical protein
LTPAVTPGFATVTISANGKNLTTSPTILLAAPLNDTFGGSGGCRADGNARVRVVDGDGEPLAGANVMIGNTELLDLYVTTYRSASDGASTSLTDANGYVEFRDFGPHLDGPLTVTAAAEDRQYLTFVAMNASDFVLPLRLLDPDEETGWVRGDIFPIAAPANDPIEFGIALPDLTLDSLARFDLADLLADNECFDVGGLGGEVPLPGNVYIPAQCALSFIICLQSLPERPYFLRPINRGSRLLVGLDGAVPLSDAQGSGALGELFRNGFDFIDHIGVAGLAVSTPGPTTQDIELTEPFSENVSCQITNPPLNSEVLCITGADWDSASFPDMTPGEGRLFITGFRGAASMPGPLPFLIDRVTTVPKQGAFTDIDYLGGAVALYPPVDPNDPNQPVIPEGAELGSTAILERSGVPFGASGGTMSFNDFFPIRTLERLGRDFSLSTLPGVGHPAPGYSKTAIARLVTEPYAACPPTDPNQPFDSARNSKQTFWEIYTPFGFDTWALPTPGSGWPRAGLGGDLAGLINTTGTPEDDVLVWQAQTIYEGLHPSFDYDAFSLFDFRRFVTHVTTNQADY